MKISTRSPSNLRKIFGQNLKMLSQRHRSISDLSRKLEINRTQLNRYLSGESFPGPDILDRICRYFDVDARILLEPLAEIKTQASLLSNPYLNEYLGEAFHSVSPDMFPSGFYRFSRQSFVCPGEYFTGVVHVSRVQETVYLRGFDSKASMRAQQLPVKRKAREFRGFAMHLEDGISIIVSRIHGVTASFTQLNRASSFDNNFWAGYASRTTREHRDSERVTRIVYEYLGPKVADALPAARVAGLCDQSQIPPFHQRLLHLGEQFH